MITLMGATGYTGRLVARALSRHGLPFRLAGRSPDRLARLSDTLPQAPSWLIADASQPDTLRALFQDARVVVSCAGPFTDLGPPLVVQAALHGVHYLDIANELGYVFQVQGYHPLALRGGAAVVPACGFEVALADCAAAILAQEEMAGPALDEISVVYDIQGRGSSFGSRRSAVRSLATSWLGYRDGRWGHAIPGRQGRRVSLSGGMRPALSFPSSEIVTVPNQVPVRQVMTWMVVSWHALFWAPVLVPSFAWLARGPVGRLVEALISRIYPPPETGLRSEAPFAIRVEARRDSQCRAMALTGKGVYDLTAEIVAYAAAQMVQPGFEKAGVLAPAAAFDPRALLDRAVDSWGVTMRCES
jgi:short subunit dehydrogenase-like uncharacterized protein